MELNDVALEIQDLGKKVKKKHLLKPLSFQLRRGKILALCGGNGAGKSTLIRLILGLIKPTTGHVMILGKETKKNRQSSLQYVGYMPDHFQFPGKLTAKETIDFYARLQHVSTETYLVTLEKVGLFDYLHEKVDHFSKGMNQRLLLAQVLMTNPHLLILDEPTNGLDPYWVDQFCELMLMAKNNGQTVILSTHDLHVAEKIADEVVFLNHGEVMSQGTIEQYQETGLYDSFHRLVTPK